jgi:hypothetical protein
MADSDMPQMFVKCGDNCAQFMNKCSWKPSSAITTLLWTIHETKW